MKNSKLCKSRGVIASLLRYFSLLILVNIILFKTSYAQTVIVNYDFNIVSAYPVDASNTAPNINCKINCTEPFLTFTGINSGVQAFANNPTGGQALAMQNSSGINTRYWTVSVSGSDLQNYKSYKLYLQARRSSTGAQKLTLYYSTDGINYSSLSFISFAGFDQFYECIFDLTNIENLDLVNTVYFKLAASEATSTTGTLRIDNLQLSALKVVNGNTGSYNWQLTGNANSDENTNFIGTTDNHDFVIKTNNTEQVRVKTTGLLLAKEITLGNKLNFNGTTGQITSADGIIDFGSSNITSTGNITANNVTTIGTLTTQNFHAGNTIMDSIQILDNIKIGTGTLILKSNENSIYANNGNLKLQCGLSSYNIILNAGLNSGNTGIGTTSPQKKLHVKTSELQENPGEFGGTIRIEHEITGVTSSVWDISPTAVTSTSDYLNRLDFIAPNSSTTPVLSLVKNGKVGIGTTAPKEQVEVNGAIKIGTTDNVNSGTIRFKNNEFEGNTDGTAQGWKSLTDNGVWSKIGTTEDIEYLEGNVQISPDKHITLKDNYHGLGYFNNTFASQTVNGPVLYGWSGGALGSRYYVTQGSDIEKIALQWDYNGNVKISGSIKIEGSDLVLGTNDTRAQGTKLKNRALVHDGWQANSDNLVINYDGDFEDGVFIMGPKTVINGNVAIGNPSTIDAKLHVVGDVKIEGLADGSTTKMVVAEPDGKLSTKTLSINTSTDGTSTTTTLSGSNIELGDPANPVSNVNVNGSIELPLSANSSSSTTAGITLDGFTTSKFSYNSLSLKRYGFGFHNPTQSTTSSNGSFISGYGGIDFFTSDNNRLSIKQSGKVGIGTDDPKERLQLGDLFTFHTGGTKMIGRNVYWDNDAGYSKKILSVETNGVLPSSSALKFNADGSIGFSVDNNTADPNDATGFKIKWINPFNISKSGNIVLGDPNTTDFPSTLTVNSSLNFKTLQDKSGDASAKMLVWNSTDYSVGTKEITGLCDDITCDGNGHVGIGTTTPNAQIHIKGKNSQSPKIRFEDIVGLAQYQSIWDISQSSNGLEFLHGTFGSNPVSKFKISEWGHIGIGAPSPQAILHIKSDGSGFEENGNVLPIVENTGTGAAGWKFLTGGGINGPYWIIHAAGGSNQGLGKFVFRSDSVEVMTLTREKKDGWNDVRRVGIGTTSPTSNLQVQNAENTDIRVKSTGSNKTALLWAANNNFGLAFGIGTDNKGHIYYNETSPQESMTFLNNGNVGIGTPTPDEKLQVKGNIKACKVIVANPGGGWCDYVFDDKYKLPSLFDVEQYVKQHKHLPDVPSEKEVTENGIDVGQMNTILLKKIEELTLYSIEQQKQLEKQQLQISSLINDVEKIKK